MYNVTKETFLNTIACPLLGWLTRNRKLTKEPKTTGEEFRLWQGLEIHKRARSIYPEGIWVKEKVIPVAAEMTSSGRAGD